MEYKISPFFSIIIPVYKVEKYLHECVDSILNQDFTDLEVILVDDGSPDSCPLICDAYAQADPRVKVIHRENGGLSAARNSGLDQAKGEYVLFLDSDDYYLSDSFLSAAHSRVVETEADILFHRRRRYEEATGRMEEAPVPYSAEITAEKDVGKLYKLLAQQDQLDASAALKVIRRKFLTGNEHYFEEGLLSEDVEWFFRVSKYVKRAAVLNHAAYCYRLREGSITHTKSKKHIMDMVYIVSKHADWLKTEDRSKELTAALLSYLSYQFFITLGFLSIYVKDDKKLVKNFRNEYKWLAKYSLSKKTKIAAAVVRIFGPFAPAILGQYITHK